MKSFLIYWPIIGAVALAALANSVSASWAKEANRFTPQLALLIVLGPLVFITFGIVTARVGGLAVASGVVDSLLTITSIGIGLVLFGEWSKLTAWQYLGMILATIGILFMTFFGERHS